MIFFAISNITKNNKIHSNMLPAHPHPPIHSRKNNFELNTKSFSRPLLFFLDRNALFYESRKKYVKAFIHPKIVSTSRADKHLQKKTYDMFSRVR